MNSGTNISWLKDQEMSPRRFPPVGHNHQQSIARVQPLVPELSIFVSSSTNRSLENLQEPSKQQIAPKGDQNTDMSRKPNLKSNLKQTESNSTTIKEPQKENIAPAHSKDLYDVLSWQNDQITKLQQQLEVLLSRDQQQHASVQQTSTPSSEQKVNESITKLSEVCGGNLDDTIDTVISARSHQREESNSEPTPATTVDRSTQTSFPPCSCNHVSVQVDLGKESRKSRYEHQGKEISNSSMELGDSASVYSRENFINKKINEVQSAEKDKVNVMSATMQRLRQMGVSFISPEHISPVRESEEQKKHYDTMISPRLELNESCTSTTESSLAINTAALKYLDDRQLTNLARYNERGKTESPKLDLRKRLAIKNGAPLGQDSSPVVTQYGLAESHLSMGTKQFLEHNQLGHTPTNRAIRNVSFYDVDDVFSSDPTDDVLKDLTKMLNK